jgi:pyruvate formate-lyase/glycerol dehydratase family glycyl radical enzyme
MNDRIRMFKARALNSRQLGDPRAGSLYAESLAQTVGQPEVLRQAQAQAYYFRHQDVVIREGELLVGTWPGLSSDSAVQPVPAIFGRQAFQGRSSWLPPAAPDNHFEACFQAGLLSWAGNHKTLDFQRVFDVGILGLMAQIEARLAHLQPDEKDFQQRRDFLSALLIVAQGYLDLSARYAVRADELARDCPDPQRKVELEVIARNCRRVPAQPPITFWEACQCAWFAFYLVPDAPGRVDQYLYPCYAQDRVEGTLTREFAIELLENLWCKYFETAGGTSGVSAHNHLTLGGVLPDGRDASNEITTLCLEVIEDTQLYRPQVGLRWNRHTPPELLKRAVRVLGCGTGNPDFCNDEQIVPALVRAGVRLEDARDFSLSGCHEVVVTGCAQMGSVEGFINMPMVLRMALGLEPTLQDGVDLATLDSYESLWRALLRSLEFVACQAHSASVYRDRAIAERCGEQLEVALVTRDCIENARGFAQGGARYNFCNWNVIGIANLVDSLAAIRSWVYEQRALSLQEMMSILTTDWEGRESLRREIMGSALHFGNDRSEVDAIAIRLITSLYEIIKRNTPYRGGEYILGTTAGGENMHIEFGRMTGATPDGRKAGNPLADSLGAAQGRDRQGVTALLNSVASLPHQLLPTATTLNVKLDPTLLQSDAGLDGIAALIATHFRTGGQQLQFNLVSREVLLDAKQHPELYPNLMVRVAGYSAPFTSLWGDLQDEIIARTAHELSC